VICHGLEGAGRGIFQYIIPAFAVGKLRKLQKENQGSHTFKIHVLSTNVTPIFP
jgi:hypothetical protein